MQKISEIRIRDPFILPVKETGEYFMYLNSKNYHENEAGRELQPGEFPLGFDCYRSKDLDYWTGPEPVFRPEPDFWGRLDYWAPEVHAWKEKFYMFASFHAENHYRATQILISDSPAGPFVPLTDNPATPKDWQCLDGTLHVENDGSPWMVFCHEWLEVCNGGMYAQQLSDDLKEPVGPPMFLFRASEAPWSVGFGNEFDYHKKFPCYITDGPFLYRNRNGSLLMLWSSAGTRGYAMGIARSVSGTVAGPWKHDSEPLWKEDGGHGMIFHTFDGKLMLALHQPNSGLKEHAHFFELEDTEDSIRLKQ